MKRNRILPYIAAFSGIYLTSNAIGSGYIEGGLRQEESIGKEESSSDLEDLVALAAGLFIFGGVIYYIGKEDDTVPNPDPTGEF